MRSCWIWKLFARPILFGFILWCLAGGLMEVYAGEHGNSMCTLGLFMLL